MKRRKVLTWVDTTPYHCPECGHVFGEPRVVVDNHAAPQLKTSEAVLGIGGHLISCPQCNKKHLLRVEMGGSFFTGFGAGVKPKITLFRVLPGYQGLEVEQERDLVIEEEEEEEGRPPDVEAVQSWELRERLTELWVVKKGVGELGDLGIEGLKNLGIEELRD